MEMHWEKVAHEREDGGSRTTSRLKVEGGWLYRVEANVIVSERSRQFVAALQFVPDAESKKK